MFFPAPGTECFADRNRNEGKAEPRLCISFQGQPDQAPGKYVIKLTEELVYFVLLRAGVMRAAPHTVHAQ